ncbi:Hypothetical predicted protein [Octopus vulgaris]|uniref:Uncharacterized protein n=1 Tax=Octopus vulgaris TaxID=6645 RepID=A0AA36BK56_OCTVU|nr:Hypothetical predicted protein [Octopus vulgaris]
MEVQTQQHGGDMEGLRRLIQVQISEEDSSPSSHIPSSTAVPSFVAFDSASELWPDYWSNAVPDQHKAKIFVTNQTVAIYK